jgi:hypothetical protein
MTDAYPPFGLGHPRTELRRQLVEAVLAGKKTSTAGPETEIVAVRFRVVETI